MSLRHYFAAIIVYYAMLSPLILLWRHACYFALLLLGAAAFIDAAASYFLRAFADYGCLFAAGFRTLMRFISPAFFHTLSLAAA